MCRRVVMPNFSKNVMVHSHGLRYLSQGKYLNRKWYTCPSSSSWENKDEPWRMKMLDAWKSIWSMTCGNQGLQSYWFTFLFQRMNQSRAIGSRAIQFISSSASHMMYVRLVKHTCGAVWCNAFIYLYYFKTAEPPCLS